MAVPGWEAEAEPGEGFDTPGAGRYDAQRRVPVITGAHAIIYSTDAEADRAFLRDVLGFPNVDAGDGWLIFALPPAEVAIHPGDENDRHGLYLMTDNVVALVASLKGHGIAASPIVDRGWGILTQVTLPGGGTLGVYQPRHASPPRRAATP
jgi:catechol 2,3-dioxygenase-like lactoylglutathione lyase family enzyme